MAITLVVAVLYAALPMFSIPLFGFNYGWDYVAQFFKIGRYMEMIPFLMPFIGFVGTVACLLAKGRAPHILSISFTALPLMFFGYFIYMMADYPQGTIYGADMKQITMLSTINWSVWLCLAFSLVAFVVAAVLVYRENKNNKLQ